MASHDIARAVLAGFRTLRTTHTADDVRRAIVKALGKWAAVTLRDGGGIYWVPSVYAAELRRLQGAVEKIGASWSAPSRRSRRRSRWTSCAARRARSPRSRSRTTRSTRCWRSATRAAARGSRRRIGGGKSRSGSFGRRRGSPARTRPVPRISRSWSTACGVSPRSARRWRASSATWPTRQACRASRSSMPRARSRARSRAQGRRPQDLHRAGRAGGRAVRRVAGQAAGAGEVRRPADQDGARRRGR